MPKSLSKVTPRIVVPALGVLIGVLGPAFLIAERMTAGADKLRSSDSGTIAGPRETSPTRQPESVVAMSLPIRSPGCGKSPPTQPGATETLRLTHDGLERTYNVHLPPSYKPRRTHRLVLAFHGYSSSAAVAEHGTSGMSQHADAKGYIAVYPESTRFRADGSRPISSWNDGACASSPGPEGPTCTAGSFQYPFPAACGPARCNWCNCVDDVGFVAAMLDEIENAYCINTRRIYATGFSNGGMFVQRLACDLANRFAAVSPSHGQLHVGFNCAPSEALSVMSVWGKRDRTVPGAGEISSDGYLYTPVAEVTELFAGPESQKCDATETVYSSPADGERGWACTQRANCARGRQVVACSWNGGHSWPANDDGVYFGLDTVWRFFKKNRKPR